VPPSRLEVIRDNLKICGKPENEDPTFRDHTNPMRIEGGILVKTFFNENIL